MARTKKEENEVLETQGIERETAENVNVHAGEYNDMPKGLVNCLRNERVIVRHIPKATGLVTDPKHVLYGGMSAAANRKFSVPRLRSGVFADVLTDAEKNYLEWAMGLEKNALSVYRKENNFWDDSNESGISRVELEKGDNIFDLSIPEDYIRYKILLANKNFIAPSITELQNNRLASYQFVIVNEGDDTKLAKTQMSSTMRCYTELGKIMEDFDTLRVVIETITGKPVDASTKLDWLQGKANELIQASAKLFLNVVTDELLKYKVLIKQAIEAGVISYRGDQLYLTENNMPLCEFKEEPTLSNAAKYLANPKHQDLLFTIQAKVKQ